MMYLRDNEIYKYKIPFELPTVTTIGWLDSKHDYTSGKVPAELVDKLWLCVERRNEKFDLHVNRVRGVHPCNLCGNDVQKHREKQAPIMLGTSEIWIPNKFGWFASPSMIVHYIEEHGYQPPGPYIEALENLDLEIEINSQKTFEEIVKPIMLERG